MKTYLIDHLLRSSSLIFLRRFTQFIDMFDILLIITFVLLASHLVCLLILKLSINIKHLYIFFHSWPILKDFLKFHPPPHVYFDPWFTKFKKNVWPPSPAPFIRHLRVHVLHINNFKNFHYSWRIWRWNAELGIQFFFIAVFWK